MAWIGCGIRNEEEDEENEEEEKESSIGREKEKIYRWMMIPPARIFVFSPSFSSRAVPRGRGKERLS